MPFSYDYGKNDVKHHFEIHIPITAKILDVGPGVGTYSNLLTPSGYKLDCLEIFPRYITDYDLVEKYNKVMVGDIRKFDFDEYEYLIMGDVLEHLTFEESIKFLNQVKSSNQKCLVAVPYLLEQGEEYGNPYETHHQPDLTPEIMFKRYPFLRLLIRNNAYGYYINYEPI